MQPWRHSVCRCNKRQALGAFVKAGAQKWWLIVKEFEIKPD
jgi:hypothetical protein